MNPLPPARRLIDDYHFHLARTELPEPGDNTPEPSLSMPQAAVSNDVERVSQVVCSSAFRGKARGHGISVSYLIDPRGSGTVVFSWRILLDKRCEPTLVVLRNGKKFHEASKQLSGDISDHLTHNERFQFVFGLIVGGRELQRPAVFEISPPTFKPTEPIKSRDALRAEKDAWKQKQSEQLRRYETDPDKLRIELAKIDQAAVDKFGEL
jgi:hypothetical protein